MARIVGRLKARQVANARPRGKCTRGKNEGKARRAIFLADGGGLYLQCTLAHDGSVTRSWVFKYEVGGKTLKIGRKKEKREGTRHEIGLGPLHTLDLADARAKAKALRQQLLDGLDPMVERRKREQARIVEAAKAVTFTQVAKKYLDLHLNSFKNAKHQAQWRSTLETYVYPKIGHMTIADIGPADVIRCIEPIWNTKRETASRVRQRIERIFDYATTRQYRSGDNPAAHITETLPKKKNGKGHHAAMPYGDLPAFMAELRARDSMSARALEFTILTAARTGETIGGATWDELDLKAQVWTIPGERMKAGKEHRVPLCPRVLAILRDLPRHGDRIFPLSNMGMLELLRGMRPGLTTHGFRSTFKDWVSECTNYPNIVSEMALAHTVPDKVEAAYRRGDLFEKRRRLMAAWDKFCATKPAAAAGGNVVTLAGVRGA
jgi:integrase